MEYILGLIKFYNSYIANKDIANIDKFNYLILLMENPARVIQGIILRNDNYKSGN